ncbi:MAG: glucuronate isomerase [Acutalibacteraceae bacterium]|jgi:glucuronate isomerase
MSRFYDDELLLHGDAAKQLYQECACGKPIYDYHCHLNPQEIYENKPFHDLGEMWLAGDHYKWRAMRQNGVDERLITGDADFHEKYRAWSGAVPYMVGSPLYHWTQMELAQIFDIRRPLTPDSADGIWDETRAKMADGSLTPRSLMKRFDVRVVCTTDDPCDDLRYHRLLAQEKGFGTTVLPTFRPDKLYTGMGTPDFAAYVARLGEVSGRPISDFDGFLDAIESRLDYFVQSGCVISDHSVAHPPVVHGDKADAASAFDAAMKGEPVDALDQEKYLDFLLRTLAGWYRRRGMVMQLHMSPIRNASRVMFRKLGPDHGFDTVGSIVNPEDLCRMLADMEEAGGLPKMVLYSLNAASNESIITALGSFAGEVPGKLQLGSAWWFADHVDGIDRQIRLTAANGALGRFIGMLTDSRSFTSYVRFDYFRRILCNAIGGWVDGGEYPDDGYLRQMVEGICCKNAEQFFGFGK